MVDVVLSYCHNTLNDTTLADLLPYFKEKGVGVISASCTSMGMFTKQASPLLICTAAPSVHACKAMPYSIREDCTQHSGFCVAFGE